MADKKDKDTPETPDGLDAQSAADDATADAPVEGSETPAVAAEATEAETAAEAPAAEAPEPEAAAPEAAEAEAPAVDAPKAEAPEAETPEAETPEADAPQSSEASEDQGSVAEPPAEGSEPVATAASAAVAPGEELSPKERRRRTRSKHAGEARPARSPEERHAERLLERRTKAVRRRARRLQERAKAAERRAAAPAPEPLAPVHAPVEGKRKVRQGVVVSDKAEKTITVRIDVARRHRRYEKIVRSSNTLHAHDENNDAHEGDVVRVIESRPLSRTKRWKLIDVLERAR
jgi:small subunit ribosomal protein S17